MTIEIKEYYSIIRCDYCPEKMDINSADYVYVLSTLKLYGWIVQKDHNFCWENVCPVCQRVPGVIKEVII